MSQEPLLSPIKRVSIYCRDVERSLAFYRDLLGMTVAEDKIVGGPAMAKLVNLPPDCKMRIIYLQPDPQLDTGLIGLFAVLHPAIPEAPRLPVGQLHAGQPSVVFSSSRGDEIYAALVKAGVQFMTPPTPYTKATDDKYMKAGVYTEMIFYDPDGLKLSIIGYKPLPT